MNRGLIIVAFLGFFVAPGVSSAAEGPDFAREVRPVLARHCLKCHGPDDQARKGNLRLDLSEAARVAAKSGELAIVPGRTDRGTLLQRIFSTDPDEVMPPPATKNPLSSAERETLKEWIAAGAEYKQHWAFVPPRQAPLPEVKAASWIQNPIDRFVLAKLEAAGVEPSPKANRLTLIRRVYLDLLGLPPTPEAVDAFISDESADAYPKLVDGVLANPHYGERWARRWLDLARYADTNGYEKDRVRSIWPYRDWVINALNADMPFDQFTIEQIAGDMLPNATVEQKIATGFHRNTMLNEEGGIDPLEFQWKAVVDRNNTTATTWLGLTLGCAQCHTHKFDPIPHREYYQMMAFLHNADEPVMPVPKPEIAARRAMIQRQIDEKIAALADAFPVREPAISWTTPAPVSAGGKSAKLAVLPDASILASGAIADRETYTVELVTPSSHLGRLRLEVLSDASLPAGGPGRAENGNFVLNQVSLSVAPAAEGASVTAIKLRRPQADFSQEGWPVGAAIGSDKTKGWGVDGGGKEKAHAATFVFDPPAIAGGPARWTVRLDQHYGKHHTLGRFKISLGAVVADTSSPTADSAEKRRDALQRSFNRWLDRETTRAVRWTVLRPVQMKSNVAVLNGMEDGSIFVSGDQSKRDVYDLLLHSSLSNITAIRLEALPDARLPNNGPGRIYYEGPPGSFFLSAMTLSAAGKPVAFNRASQTFADGGNGASGAIDDDPLTGWSIAGGEGRTQTAVFNLAKPLEKPEDLSLSLVFEKYYSAPLGRFRISVTDDPRAVEASKIPADMEDLLASGPARRTAEQREKLLSYFLLVAPELEAEHDAIDQLHKQMPEFPTTLVMRERAPQDRRATFIHHRGEYLQPTERVEANVLSILPPLPPGQPHDRLTFARWLVDRANPLTARVTVNRQWAAFFGTGIVSTLGDFGYQGESPSHPELLDWLAVEFMKEGWSLKKLHRLIVTSATYQESSRVSEDLLERDPQNRLLARGPKFRLDAELIRDCALSSSGLLSEKVGGPSVFPPQPASVTTEGAYGALPWNVSTGEDRYRRGLYTFAKRTAPFAMFTVFDAPSGEACLARRDVSDSPLQALTLLNDEVFVEAAQALGRRVMKQSGDDEARLAYLFRRCLCRLPDAEERAAVMSFYQAQKARFARKELDPMTIAGEGAGDAAERAAWTVTARSLLNLDEAVTKS